MKFKMGDKTTTLKRLREEERSIREDQIVLMERERQLRKMQMLVECAPDSFEIDVESEREIADKFEDFKKYMNDLGFDLEHD